MDYLTLALILFGIGVLLLLVEILVPTGGILVVVALIPFAAGVGIIMYYGSTLEAVVALVGLGLGLPAVGYVALSAWEKMSLDTVLDTPSAPPVPTTTDADVLK